jgi:hypothetical protein
VSLVSFVVWGLKKFAKINEWENGEENLRIQEFRVENGEGKVCLVPSWFVKVFEASKTNSEMFKTFRFKCFVARVLKAFQLKHPQLSMF